MVHQHECNTHNFNLIQKIKQGFFFLYYISCKENKCWAIFLEIKGNRCLNFSSYSRPEIWEFQGVTSAGQQ
jgi:hypothetical protein